MNVKKIFACLLLSVAAAPLFGCTKGTAEDVVLPDIVFVKFCQDYKYKITGEYIDKDGNIRGFEFKDGDWKEHDYQDDPINKIKRMNQYTDVRNVKAVNDMITQHYKESDDSDVIRTADKEKLDKYYNELLQVNTNKKMKMEGYTVFNVVDPWACMYGIRKKDDATDEIVFIREYQTAYLTTKEKNANNLFTDLGKFFSEIDKVPLYGW